MSQYNYRNHNSFANVLDDLFYGVQQLNDNFYQRHMVNILEDDKQYQIQVVAPGFEKDEVKILLDKSNIEISLKAKEVNNQEENQKPKEKYLHQEFEKNNFKKSFVMPDDVDREKIASKLENGILFVVLPKLEPKSQDIQVRNILVS